MPPTKVGIREFREKLASYLESRKPVAITRHGETLGVYIPSRPKPTQAELDAYLAAATRMEEALDAAGVTQDEILADFKEARRKDREQEPKAS